jgi:ABC-type multidrug transport system ATPase subunit
MRERTATGMAVLVASEHPTRISALVDQAALFSRGRLVAEGALARIVERFRRLRFVNRLTETRTAFGTELDEFDAVRVRVRGWGIEAVIANFDELAFERLRGRDGVFDAEAEPMTLAEIAEACAEGA